MNPLPSIASSNIANLLTKNLPTTTHHRYIQFVIGDDPTAIATPTTSVATATVDIASTVDTAPTVVASATTTTSDLVLVPTIIHPNPVPYLVDTGASFPIASASASDFTPFGLIRSAALVVSNTKVSSKASLSNDPYTLITGEDATTIDFDLSSSDLFALYSDSVETFDIWEFGTATLVFISNPKLTTILVEPTVDWTDWFDWIPLPRLTPTESYYHIFGLDYSQAFALFHLISIWIYCLLHFGLE